MKIDKIVCDFCSLNQPAPSELPRVALLSPVITVFLEVAGKFTRHDFCGENCLRQHLIAREAERK